MKKIIIGEEKEYVRRLSDYLIRHMPADVRIYSFTTVDHLMDYGEDADLYLLGTDFYEDLISRDSSYEQKKVIFLSDQSGSDMFCKWDSPGKLVKLLREQLSVFSLDDHARADYRAQLIALFTPYAGASLREKILPRMGQGDLYLGMEDIGAPAGAEDISREDRKDMGELCYYIRLRDEDILVKLDKMLTKTESGYYLDSPQWYFDFLGLGEEDYSWFYDKIRNRSGYRKIYIGLGNAAVLSMEYFQMFDSLIIFDVPRHPKIHAFCERLAHTVVEEAYLNDDMVEVIS